MSGARSDQVAGGLKIHAHLYLLYPYVCVCTTVVVRGYLTCSWEVSAYLDSFFDLFCVFIAYWYTQVREELSTWGPWLHWYYGCRL